MSLVSTSEERVFTCWLGRRLDKLNSEWLFMRLGVIGGTGLVEVDLPQRLEQIADGDAAPSVKDAEEGG